MRRKTRRGRAKPSASRMSSPSPSQDVAGKDSNVPDANNCNDDGEQHATEIPFEKSLPGGSPSVSGQESADIYLLLKQSCLECGKGGQLLVCSEPGCPIAYHEKCLSSEPEIGSAGNYYCPYCSYKRAVTKLHTSRRGVKWTRKALSAFLATEVGDEGQKEQKSGKDNEKDSSAFPCPGQENVRDENGKDNSEGQHQSSSANPDHNKHEELVANQTDTSAPCANGQKYGFHEGESREVIDGHCVEGLDQQRAEISEDGHSDEMAAEDAVHCASSKAEGRDKSVHGSQGLIKNQEQGELQSGDTTVSSSKGDFVTDAIHTGNEARDFETEPVSMNSRHPSVVPQDKARPEKVVSTRKVSFQSGVSNQKDAGDKLKGATPAEKLRQEQRSSSELVKPPLHNVKRRRLWSSEEEEMLKEGVQAFSSDVNKNIPWRKILEYGSRVFESTRTATDLKDKWKNMTSRR